MSGSFLSLHEAFGYTSEAGTISTRYLSSRPEVLLAHFCHSTIGSQHTWRNTFKGKTQAKLNLVTSSSKDFSAKFSAMAPSIELQHPERVHALSDPPSPKNEASSSGQARERSISNNSSSGDEHGPDIPLVVRSTRYDDGEFVVTITSDTDHAGTAALSSAISPSSPMGGTSDQTNPTQAIESSFTGPGIWARAASRRRSMSPSPRLSDPCGWIDTLANYCLACGVVGNICFVICVVVVLFIVLLVSVFLSLLLVRAISPAFVFVYKMAFYGYEEDP